jgi:hypothetical protein
MSKRESVALLALLDTMMMDALTSGLSNEARYVPPMPQKAKRKCLRRGCTNDEVRNGFCCAECCRQYQIDKREERRCTKT